MCVCVLERVGWLENRIGQAREPSREKQNHEWMRHIMCSCIIKFYKH